MTRPAEFPTLWEILEENARSYPGQEAVVCDDVRLRFPELERRVGRLSGGLVRRGLQRGDRVLWLGQNCHRVLELLVAASRVGALLCVANWRSSIAELEFILDDLKPKFVVWEPNELLGDVSKFSGSVDQFATWLTKGEFDDLAESEAESEEGCAGEADDPVLLLYSAAFEGKPNGALFSNVSLYAQNLILSVSRGIDRQERNLNCGPLFHIATTAPMLATFHFGGTNVFVPRADPEAICKAIDREKCTSAFIVGPTIARMIELNRDDRYDLSSLRAPTGSSEGSAMAQAKRPAEQVYALTQGGVVVTTSALGGTGHQGRPVAGYLLRILDEKGDPVGQGQSGEIAIRGPGVMLGYYNRPEENARIFSDGWLKTGDLGRRDPDGSVTFLGSMRRLLKSGLENIYPVEIEQCLLAHEAVKDAAVIGIPDPVWVQRVKAVVVQEEGTSTSEDELIEHCRTHLASYKKPSEVVFVEALPRNGPAIDYEELDRRYGGGGYPGSVPL